MLWHSPPAPRRKRPAREKPGRQAKYGASLTIATADCPYCEFSREDCELTRLRYTSRMQRDFASADRRTSRIVSTLVNGNVTVAGRRTSIRLEPPMWEALHQICCREGKAINELVTEIDRGRAASTLTAAIRVYLLTYFRAAATDEGHRLAGHGTGAGIRPSCCP